jgi:hypothetical protein
MKGMLAYRCGEFAVPQTVATVYKAVYKALHCVPVAKIHRAFELFAAPDIRFWSIEFKFCEV